MNAMGVAEHSHRIHFSESLSPRLKVERSEDGVSRNLGALANLCYDSFKMDRRRLVFYLLLNVFVSACVTLSILYWYDRNYRAVTLPQVALPTISSNAASGAAATLQPGTVQIVSVIGAGTLSAEAVIIRYNGEGELDLTGWHLKDANNNIYTFPPFKLFKNGVVQVHTSTGTNSAIVLYWSQNQAMWKSGEAVLLTDPQDVVQYSYPVP